MVFNGKHTLAGNVATFGGAVWVEESMLNFTGNTDFVSNEATYGGAIYADEGSELVLSATSTFNSNAAKPNGYGGYGGGIHVIRSKLTLSGLQNFTNNSAKYGGGLTISNYDQNHFLSFVSATVHLIGNYAEKRGGAIFIEDAPFTYCVSDINRNTPGRTCFFKSRTMESDDKEYESLQELPIYMQTYLNDYVDSCMGKITFEGNCAEEGGNAIYGGALQKCRVEFNYLLLLQSCNYFFEEATYYVSGLEAVAAMTQMTVEKMTQDPLDVASDAFTVIVCGTLEPHCNQSIVSCTVYPGQTIFFPVVVVGQVNGVVPAVIHATFTESEDSWLGHLQNTQPATLFCTSLGYTLLSKSTRSNTLSLSAEGPCGEFGIPLTMHMTFLPCPSGFALSRSSGSCERDGRLSRYTNSCDINDSTITRDGEFWIGYDSQSQGLILHPHCPFDYCTLVAVSFTIDSTDLQCARKRSGNLCGACKHGLSLNLGSSKCSSCSDLFLLLFVPFAAAGFLLVLFLFIFKITVAAGTTSGLIFYANVVTANHSVFLPSGETNILTVFIAWLNMDLGFETCLFNGMDAYTRTWLQFVFLLYIWLLVGLITLISYYSTTIARIIGPTNPIAVLATLFLLSYTKLLRTIIATFSFTSLDYPNGSITVWVYDGNVVFLEGQHIALFLVGLIAFLLLFLPYTLLLLFDSG